jgi:hypothetical protein
VSVVVIGLNHRTMPLDLFERMTVDGARLPKALHDLAAREHLGEVVVLSTCNRTEVYAIAERFHGAYGDVRNFLSELAFVPPTSSPTTSTSTTTPRPSGTCSPWPPGSTPRCSARPRSWARSAPRGSKPVRSRHGRPGPQPVVPPRPGDRQAGPHRDRHRPGHRLGVARRGRDGRRAPGRPHRQAGADPGRRRDGRGHGHRAPGRRRVRRARGQPHLAQGPGPGRPHRRPGRPPVGPAARPARASTSSSPPPAATVPVVEHDDFAPVMAERAGPAAAHRRHRRAPRRRPDGARPARRHPARHHDLRTLRPGRHRAAQPRAGRGRGDHRRGDRPLPHRRLRPLGGPGGGALHRGPTRCATRSWPASTPGSTGSTPASARRSRRWCTKGLVQAPAPAHGHAQGARRDPPPATASPRPRASSTTSTTRLARRRPRPPGAVRARHAGQPARPLAGRPTWPAAGHRLARPRSSWCSWTPRATGASTCRSPRFGGKGVFAKEVQAAVLDGRRRLRRPLGQGPAAVTVDRAWCSPRARARRRPRRAGRRSTLRPARRVPRWPPARSGGGPSSPGSGPTSSFTELRGNMATRLAKVPDGGAIVVAAVALRAARPRRPPDRGPVADDEMVPAGRARGRWPWSAGPTTRP